MKPPYSLHNTCSVMGFGKLILSRHSLKSYLACQLKKETSNEIYQHVQINSASSSTRNSSKLRQILSSNLSLLESSHQQVLKSIAHDNPQESSVSFSSSTISIAVESLSLILRKIGLFMYPTMREWIVI